MECKKFKLLIFPSFFLILNLCDLNIVIQFYVPLNIDIHLSILSQGGRRYCTVICHLSVHLNWTTPIAEIIQWAERLTYISDNAERERKRGMTRLACVVYMQKREVVVRELGATPGRNVLVLFNFLWRNKWIDSVKFVCEYMKFVTTCVVTNRNLQNTDQVLAKNVVGHLEARMWYGRTSQLHASYGV